MRRACPLLLALIVSLAASHPAAANQFRVHWSGCGSSGATSHTFACDTDAGADTLILSVVSSGDFIIAAGADLIVFWVTDFGQSFPPWWVAGTPSDCRFGALEVQPITTPDGDCPAYFNPSQSVDVSLGNQILDFDHGNYWWLKLTVKLHGNTWSPVLVPDGTEVALARMIVHHDHTMGSTACAGCSQTMSLSLIQMWYVDPAGNEIGLVSNDTTPPDATWNPGTTPARQSSWGAIKLRYR